MPPLNIKNFDEKIVNSYERLRSPNRFPLALIDDQPPSKPITERHIQAMWLEQIFFTPLFTTDDQEIEVLSPGIWNSEAGPDFIKAHLRIGGKELKGDVELHLKDQGWYAHRHHEDSRYDQVILHISLWTPDTPYPITTSCGATPAQTYFSPRLTVTPEDLTAFIDLDLYPYLRHSVAGKCSRELFAHLSNEECDQLFASASLARLQEKWDHLVLHIDDPSLRVAAGIAQGLGYKNNSETFLQLFRHLAQWRALPEQLLFTLALGSTGLLSSPYRERWKEFPYYRQCLLEWEQFPVEYKGSWKLNLHRIRPQNHPIRRLSYLVKFLQSSNLQTITRTITKIWEEYANGEIAPSNLIKIFCSAIPDFPGGLWDHYSSFSKKPLKQQTALIGSSLKQEMILNTFLPYLKHRFASKLQSDFERLFFSFLRSIQAMKTQKQRYLSFRFFEHTAHASQNPLKNTLMTQGAYQLHRDFCQFYEASCYGCPFIANYKYLEKSRNSLLVEQTKRENRYADC